MQPCLNSVACPKTAKILGVKKLIDPQIWTKGSLCTAGEIKGTVPAEGKRHGQKSGVQADSGTKDMMMKNKVITTSAQKFFSKHLSLVPRPSIFSFSLSNFCPFSLNVFPTWEIFSSLILKNKHHWFHKDFSSPSPTSSRTWLY